MNEQKPPYGIEWTRLPRPDGTFTKGYTWNVLSGCLHGCEWTMPDGQVAECYAKTVAEGVARSAYPDGFEVSQFHPERLQEPLAVKASAGIFLDSMSDLMGHWVPESQIWPVLDICARARQHTFFLLTKNAPRLKHFTYTDNVWVGCSSPPDQIWGEPMTRSQQARMLSVGLTWLGKVPTPVRWMSFEPLSWDCAEIVAQYPGVLTWAVIGAASRGRQEYPPAPETLQHLLEVLDAQGVPVFYKGNLRSLPIAAQNWRTHFPQKEGA